MFRIRLDIIAEEEQRLHKLSEELLDMAGGIEMIERSLMEYAKAELIEEAAKSLVKLRHSAEEDGLLLEKMSKILHDIRIQYEDTEQRIISDSEEIALMYKDISAGYKDISWYEKKLSAISFK